MRRAVLLLSAALPFTMVARTVSDRPPTQTDLLVNIHDMIPREHRVETFVLASPQTVRLDVVGGEPRQERGRAGKDNNDYSWNSEDDERDVWPAAAWILDARTRDVVWDLRTATSARDRNGVRRFDGAIRLPAGVFEAHYGSYVATSTSYDGDVNTIAALLRAVNLRRRVRFGGPYVDDNAYREFRLLVRGEGRRATEREAAEAARRPAENVIAALRPDSSGMTARQGFELTRATDVEVTAVGELWRNNAFDYGWILNADTRRRVWEMDYRRTEDAGGAHKNRRAHETIHLPAGHYVAYFVTDDSHDPYDWNAVPPLDPQAWGMTLRVADPAARAAVRPFNYEPVPTGQTIISMIGIGDDAMRSEGFSLRRPMDLHIYAMGEGSGGGSDDAMDDYAWIVDATRRRRVWTMRYRDTDHAGGAEKNRLFDGALHLEAGSYMVYYKSDGSHAFGHWNDAPPAEARYWGISIFPASGAMDRSAIAPFQRTAGNAIAELVRMRDGVRAQRSFTLDRDQSVQAYAIGEGTGGDMDDYGWIEDANGRVVWEMTYRLTTHAGGARKNRLFDGTVRLSAGRYVLKWVSDDSHAFGDWNDDPPDDPDGWGIAVLPARDR